MNRCRQRQSRSWFSARLIYMYKPIRQGPKSILLSYRTKDRLQNKHQQSIRMGIRLLYYDKEKELFVWMSTVSIGLTENIVLDSESLEFGIYFWGIESWICTAYSCRSNLLLAPKSFIWSEEYSDGGLRKTLDQKEPNIPFPFLIPGNSCISSKPNKRSVEAYEIK